MSTVEDPQSYRQYNYLETHKTPITGQGPSDYPVLTTSFQRKITNEKFFTKIRETVNLRWIS